MALEELFKGKCIIVTGAGNGIGRAVAQRLHKYGSKVYAVSRSQAPLDSLVKECPSIKPIQLDIGLDWGKTRKVIEDIKDVDIIINNAATTDMMKPFLDISEQDFDQAFDVNVKALFNISQRGALNMIEEKKKGSIVNISSVASFRAFEGTATYCGSKAAVDMFTKAMAMELGKHKIRVNSINLGMVRTSPFEKMNEEELKETMARYLKKVPYNQDFLPMDDVINNILYVASDMSLTLTGSCIVHDGGLTIALH